MSAKLLVAAALSVVAVSDAAWSADVPMPVKAVKAASLPGGFYVYLDGAFQMINLPRYDLGFRATAPVGASLDTGVAVHSFDPDVDGGSVAGGFGYRFADGAFSPAFGQNVRIELGGFYVNASDSQIAAEQLNPRMALALLSGNPSFNGCAAGVCSIGSTLSTDYTGWQASLKLLSDFRSGSLTISPSLAVFGGQVDVDQHLVQLDKFPPFAGPGGTNTYRANSDLSWTDWGVRLGLDARLDLSSWLAFGIGGTVGLANRDVSLSAADIYLNPAGALFGAGSATSISGSADVTPFLANAEARIFVTPMNNVRFKGFVGLNHDSKVPGIQKSSWTGDAGGPTSMTPAGIKFESQTSYYVGGGVTVNF